MLEFSAEKFFISQLQEQKSNEATDMILPKTSLNVVYIEPQITMSEEERKQQLTRFISLFAQVGYRELALNENFASELDNYCK